ncbi:hypothetical protein CAMM_00985 [Corynebacterium ammoniagenes DSM 20306]|nr:hypothetical protein CAMM_00985 [Corynebacterium ammoniagenes DSM 20306]
MNAQAGEDKVHDRHDDDDFDDHRGHGHQVIIPREVNAKGHQPPAYDRAHAPPARLIRGEQCAADAPTSNRGADNVHAWTGENAQRPGLPESGPVRVLVHLRTTSAV